jgi:hypothetical protein
MDGGMLEEAVGAKLIYNVVPQHFWNGSVLNYLHLYDEINLCQEIPTEISGMHVLDAAGTLIPWAIVLQELMLMAKA